MGAGDAFRPLTIVQPDLVAAPITGISLTERNHDLKCIREELGAELTIRDKTTNTLRWPSAAGRAPHGPCVRHIQYSHRYSCARLLGSVRARDWTGPPRKCRSCETKSIVPSYCASAVISISFVAMSRWLVGSSSTRKFGGSNNMIAIASRAFSPPDSTRHFFSTSSPENPKQPASVRSVPCPACGNESSSDWKIVRVAVEQFHRMLGKIAHLDAAADRHRALIRLARAGHQFQERRFAGAIDAHHAPALLAPDHEIQPFIDHLVSIALVNSS